MGRKTKDDSTDKLIFVAGTIFTTSMAGCGAIAITMLAHPNNWIINMVYGTVLSFVLAMDYILIGLGFFKKVKP